MVDAQETLVENLRALMQANPQIHGTQTKVARLAGLNQTSVGNILSKRHHPTTEALQGLARAFGVEVWQLLAPGLKPPRSLSPFALDMAEMIDKKLAARGAQEVREAIRAEITHHFGPGRELP